MSVRRVLMTCDAVGGVWRYALDLSRGLAERDLEVILLGLGPEPSAHQRAEADALPGVTLTWCDAPLDWLAPSLDRLSAVPDSLARAAGEHGVDLLHLNLPSQAADLVTDRPVVVASHSCLATWWRAVRGEPLPAAWGRQAGLTQAGLERADAVVVPTRAHADAVRACYGMAIGMDVVSNAVVPQPEIEDAAKEPFVVAAARWWDDGKNVGLIDRAAADAEWPVVLAGALTGPDGRVVDVGNVRALGAQPGDEVRRLMARAEILVSPSLYEPFGLAALEAASAGSALVLSDIPTYRELWNGAARFVDPADPSGLALALNELAHAPQQRASLQQAASQRAHRLSIRRQAKAMAAVYERAAASQRPSLAALTVAV
ncbi:glycosyltransferase family 4 protein (plasmid) [Marinivivus vitaminiproducens]|nr:glycosyltransferase family 4 protein [Geminicoccaceae bacterium SCSIO 64248]